MLRGSVCSVDRPIVVRQAGGKPGMETFVGAHGDTRGNVGRLAAWYRAEPVSCQAYAYIISCRIVFAVLTACYSVRYSIVGMNGTMISDRGRCVRRVALAATVRCTVRSTVRYGRVYRPLAVSFVALRYGIDFVSRLPCAPRRAAPCAIRSDRGSCRKW